MISVNEVGGGLIAYITPSHGSSLRDGVTAEHPPRLRRGTF